MAAAAPPVRTGAPQTASPAALRTSRRVLVLSAGFAVVWALLIRRFGGEDVYSVLGPFALGVTVAIAALRPRALKHELRVTPRAVISGLAVGAVMTVATYPVFDAAAALIPSLRGNVAYLYGAAATRTVLSSLPWVLVIVFAEEFLFRSALFEALGRRFRPALAIGGTVAAFAAAQSGTGSFIVVLMAIVCGAIWTVQRHALDSLLSPLIAHLIWTPVVILFKPVI
jgi:membrane protease YdiL (CAAX protease family)